MSVPSRAPWTTFPDVLLHAEIGLVKGHCGYDAAKAGDADAAARLVADCLSEAVVTALATLVPDSNPILSPVHALEMTGVNAIPLAMANGIAARTGWTVETAVVQVNIVGHTGASGFHRLARQALFDGAVSRGRPHVLVDDFVGQGGTLTNLRGHLIARGAIVPAATTLTGKAHSARLLLSRETLDSLRSKHGTDLEEWWLDRFGHGFDCLTESEARYLLRTPTADRIRDRIVAAE